MVTVFKPCFIYYWLLLINITCLPFSAFANNPAELQLSISDKTIELGKSLSIVLTSRQTNISLDEIDLSPLQPDFHIKDLAEPEIKNKQQQKKLVLYPRKMGKLIIPELTFLNATTKAIAIEVTSAIDAKNNTTIDVQTSLSTLMPWKNQQLLVKLEFISKAAILIFNTPKAYSRHSNIIPLDASSEPVEHKNQKWTRHITGWAIYPQQSGNHQLVLPAIHLVRDGVTTHRFYPPLINLKVRKLPVYIPSTMPVGKLDIEMIDEPSSPILLNNMGRLRFKLIGDGNEPGKLPLLNTQLKSSKAISIYPAKTVTTQHNTQNGIISRAIYEVNFKTNQPGHHDFKQINLSYFDPANGTIKSRTETIGSIYALPLWIIIISGVLLSSLIIIIMYKLWHWLKNKYQTYISYRDALIQINKANNPEALKSCLALIAQAENWPCNMTIRQWYFCHHSIQPESSFDELQRLEQVLYHHAEENIDKLRNDLIKLCYQQQKILKWLSVA